MITYKLSPSSLNLMVDCPRCFWLDKHKVWKRPETIFPSLPSGMDRVLKGHFDKFMEKGELPPELYHNNHCSGLKLFNDKELLNVWRNNFKGISWTDKEGNILHGAVDNLLINGKKIIVLDYKTRGYPCKDDTHEHYHLQLDIYNFLLRNNGYETEGYAFLLFYHPKEVLENGNIVFNTDLKKMKVDIKKAEEMFKKAVDLLSKDCPKKGCEWCKLIKNG